jgi:hypothetical protein
MAKKGEVKHKDRVGEKFTTNEGYVAEIIEYRNSMDLDVKLCEGTVLKNLKYANLVKGAVRNPNHKSVYGIGYSGIGEYNSHKDGKIRKSYDVWHSLMRRCYWDKYHAREKSYKDVTVCEEWHNYQNFAKWFEENYNPETMQGWDLDKDIICPECKIYSPDTCCFVPLEINKFFCKSKESRLGLMVGVKRNHKGFQCRVFIDGVRLTSKTYKTQEEASLFYNTEKEKYAKKIAEKWRGTISDIIYDKLINYKVKQNGSL